MLMTSHGLMHKNILICDMIYQKLWTTMTSGMNHPTLIVLLVSTMNPKTNISDQILILTNVKHNYETFEVDYVTVYYWILFSPAHDQYISLSHVILHMQRW